MPDDYQYLRVRLQLEQHRFVNFCLQAGTLDKNGKLCSTLQIKKDLLLAILTEIKTLFDKYYDQYAELDKRQGTAPEIIDLNQYLASSVSYEPRPEMNGVNSKGVGTDRKRHLVSLRKIGGRALSMGRNLRIIINEPRRISWVTFGKTTLQDMTANLGVLNSFLTSLLDSSQIRRLEETTREAYQEIIQLRNDVGSLQNLVKALLVDRGSVWEATHLASGLSARHHTMMSMVSRGAAAFDDLRDSAARLAELKMHHKMVDILVTSCSISTDDIKRVEENLPLSRRPTRLEYGSMILSEDPHRASDNSRKQNATYEGQHVLIEWKAAYADNTGGPFPLASHLQQQPGREEEAEHRIRLLVDLLSLDKPASFMVARCLGYVKEPPRSGDWNSKLRFGIVFQRPASELITLRQLLTGQGPKPSLTERMRLCTALAESIYNFHAVNWLYKGLQSDNIIFPVTSAGQPALSSPVLTGFELSRPASRADLTEKPTTDLFQDIYRHPSAQSSDARFNVYRKAYDIYSLGIVLTEVGLWRPIECVVGIKELAMAKPQQLLKVKEWLLGNETPLASASAVWGGRGFSEWLAAECGASFTNLVTLCLMADGVINTEFHGEPDEAAGLQKLVGREVLAKLKRIAECV
jgi:hypothetical protein